MQRNWIVLPSRKKEDKVRFFAETSIRTLRAEREEGNAKARCGEKQNTYSSTKSSRDSFGRALGLHSMGHH